MESLTTGSAWRVLAVAAVLAAAALGYAAWGPMPVRVDDWRWFRAPEPQWSAAVATLLACALAGLLALWAWRRADCLGGARLARVVAGLVALAFAIQVLAARQLPGGYQESIVALGKPGANRYHALARGIPRLGPVLGRYDEWMRDPSHKLIVTHPPGPLSLYWCLNHVFAGREGAAGRFVRWCEDWLAWGLRAKDPSGPPALVALFRGMSDAELAGAWLATFVLRLAAALVVVPVFAMARAAYGMRTGIAAAAMACVVPSLLLFSPGVDQAFPVVAATATWLAWTAGRRRSAWRAAAAGFAVSLGLFFSLSFAVVAALAGLTALGALWSVEQRPTLRGVWPLAAGAAAGFCLPLVTLYLATGYRPLAVWMACVENNARFNAASGRVYWKWLLVNPVEFLLFLGVPVAVLFVARVARGVRRAWEGRWGEADWPTLLLAGVLLALNVSGLNRGEVSRLWMFLMPGCVVAAAAQGRAYAPYRRAVFVGVFALTAVQAIVFKSLLDVLLGMYRGLV